MFVLKNIKTKLYLILCNRDFKYFVESKSVKKLLIIEQNKKINKIKHGICTRDRKNR